MAAVTSAGSLVLAVAVVGLLLVACNAGPASVYDCKGTANLIAKCKPYVMKPGPRKDPSPGCCAAIRGADLPCICKQMPPDIAHGIDVGKVCYVAGKCGVSKPPSGTKCGDVTVPKNC